jgi:tagatose 1,6-diphosphate aldolase
MFIFKNIEILSNQEIDLILTSTKEANDKLGYVPAYYFDIRLHNNDTCIGKIDLRIGHNHNTYYGGNIGYEVDEAYRGNGYAYKAVLLVAGLAKVHEMDKVIITFNPDNHASRRTAEKAGGQLIEIIDLPEDNDMYQAGERQKCRYEILLDNKK